MAQIKYSGKIENVVFRPNIRKNEIPIRLPLPICRFQLNYPVSQVNIVGTNRNGLKIQCVFGDIKTQTDFIRNLFLVTVLTQHPYTKSNQKPGQPNPVFSNNYKKIDIRIFL